MTFAEFRKLKAPVMLRTSAQDGSYVHYRYFTEIIPNEDGPVTVRERTWVGISARENNKEFELRKVDETYTLNPKLSIDRHGITEADITSPQVGKQNIIKDLLS